jgi:hypothetical protein
MAYFQLAALTMELKKKKKQRKKMKVILYLTDDYVH